MTTAQAHQLVSSALQDDEQSCVDTLAIIEYHQRRNYAAYRSHRRRSRKHKP